MGFVVTWILLAAFWVGLSGHFDTIHLVFGAVGVTLVSLLSHRHLFPSRRPGQTFLLAARFLGYLPWLLWQIVLANIDVLARVLGLRPVEPRVFAFEADVEGEFGAVLYANSITLTPGTVTVDVRGKTLVVHAIAPSAAEGVLSRTMESRIRRVEGRSPARRAQ